MRNAGAEQAISRAIAPKLGACAKWSLLVLALCAGPSALWGGPQDSGDLSQQIFDVMLHLPGNTPGVRVVHAKGIVCKGNFKAYKEAEALSRAAHFSGGSVPLTVRFSDGAADPAIPDNSPDAFPRGMAIRFMLAGGKYTDIVAISHNGFIVGNGEDFLALQKAVVETDTSKPHPWPFEAFLSTHPRAVKFIQEPKPMPASFATKAFYGNNAFVFVNAAGTKQAGRYQILPVAGEHYLSAADAKSPAPNFLSDELRMRLKAGPVKFRLTVQLANPGDPTNDASIIWPEDRRTVEMGTLTITSVVADSDAAQKELAFDPIRLTDGIELSDDPLPELRSKVYALSVKHRQSQ
jgi:catalase